jgi:hypothetical protein
MATYFAKGHNLGAGKPRTTGLAEIRHGAHAGKTEIIAQQIEAAGLARGLPETFVVRHPEVEGERAASAVTIVNQVQPVARGRSRAAGGDAQSRAGGENLRLGSATAQADL